MRHRKKFNHLGRKVGHRRALLANMASSLILHKRIKTTTAKAKALRVYIEPLITKTKGLSTVEEKTHAQRVVFGHLQNKHAVKELFDDVASKVETRPGGYTRILKLGNRPGDNADMCFIELVDYNENMLTTKEAKKTTRRSRRVGKKKSDAPQTAESTDQSTESEESAQSTATAQSEITDAEVVDTQEEAEASTQAEKSDPEAETATEEKAQSTESDTSKEEDTQSTEEGDKKEDNKDKSEGEEDNKSKE